LAKIAKVLDAGMTEAPPYDPLQAQHLDFFHIACPPAGERQLAAGRRRLRRRDGQTDLRARIVRKRFPSHAQQHITHGDDALRR